MLALGSLYNFIKALQVETYKDILDNIITICLFYISLCVVWLKTKLH